MNILIIGAGGVTSYLLPVLLKAFDVNKVYLMDEDLLEERNLDRQLFDKDMIGEYKAKALIEQFGDSTTTILEAITKFLTDTSELPEDISHIICCADNHEARRNAMHAAKEQGIPCYVAGNEYFDSQAFVYNKHNNQDNNESNPFNRYPELITSTVGSPFESCQGTLQVIHPQLAIANFSAASKVLHLMYIWETYIWDEGENLLKTNPELLTSEIYGTLFGTTHEGML